MATTTSVIVHRSTRKYAEAYIARWADTLGEQQEWNGRSFHPIHIAWDAVRSGSGWDVVSTITREEES